jgi:hypothetical protein
MGGVTIEGIVDLWRNYNELDLDKPNYRRSGHLEFSRQVLVSYNIPIACYHQPRWGKSRYVLILSEPVNSPWNTVVRHKNIALRTVNCTRFLVPSVGASGRYASPSALEQAHADNLKWFAKAINGLADAAIKEFRHHPDEGQWGSLSRVQNWVLDKYSEAGRYMDITGAEFELPPRDKVMQRIAEERERLWVQWSDPKAVARRERALARREAVKALIGELTNG